MNKFEYKRLYPFKWYVLQNFPFIEADFDAITNYQLYCKVVEYLNKILDNVNVIGNQMEEVTNAFIDLQNYVNNYFENLDVQDEINNKLDEMVLDGTLDNILTKRFSIIYKFPLHSGGETATVNSITNIKDYKPAVAVQSIERALEYQNFDNVISEIGMKDKSSSDETEVYNGLVNVIETVNNTSIVLQNEIPENYLIEGMFIVLAPTTPTKNNWTYISRIESFDIETKTINVSEWYNKSNGQPEIPTNVLYAWINPTTKFYGQHLELHRNDTDKTDALIGSQMELYGSETQTGGGVIGYSPVLRNGNGQYAFRSRAENYTWASVFHSEGHRANNGLFLDNDEIGNAIKITNEVDTDIIHYKGNSLIDKNERLGHLALQESRSIDNRKPFWILSGNVDLRDFTALNYSKYTLYNSTDNTITVQGTFRTSNNETINSINITSRTCIELFAISSTGYYIINDNNNNNTKMQGNNLKSNITYFNTNTNLDTIFTLYPNNAGVINFFTTSNVTLSSAYPIYLNGNASANSVNLAQRTSGTIIYNNQTKSFYINSVQP